METLANDLVEALLSKEFRIVRIQKHFNDLIFIGILKDGRRYFFSKRKHAIAEEAL